MHGRGIPCPLARLRRLGSIDADAIAATHAMNATLRLLPICALAAAAAAQLPAPTLRNRATPRAAWSAVLSAGTTTGATTTPPTVNATFRAGNPGAGSADTLYVFGGSLGNNTSTTTNDLWAFHAPTGTFTQSIPDGAVGSPSPRGRAAIAWNPVANKLVVFGGNTRGATPTLLNDVWEYDPVSNGWANVTPAGAAPAPRQFAAMAWDPQLGGMLVFGGQVNDVAPPLVVNDTWLFAGGAWTQFAPATSPAPRGEHSLLTRSDAFQDVVLVGGIDHGSATPEQIRHLDVWRWSAGAWSLLSNCDVLTNPTGAGTTWPASVNGNQAVYDPLRQRIVLQGGNGITVASNAIYVYGPSYGGSPSNYTSEFDCLTNTWSIYGSPTTGTTPFNNTDAAIGRVSRYYAAFLPATGKVYKACGQDPTKSGSRPTYNVYAYQAAVIANATSYGAGCSGPGGALGLASNGRPWTSRTWTGTCSNLGPTSLALAVWGAGQQQLPLAALLPIAGPGCNLLNSADALLGPVVPTGGSAAVSLALPDSAALSGVGLNVQVAELQFDLAGAWTGLFTSNGLQLTIGAL